MLAKNKRKKNGTLPLGQHFAKCEVWWQKEFCGHSAPQRPQLYSKPLLSSTTGKSPKQGNTSKKEEKNKVRFS